MSGVRFGYAAITRGNEERQAIDDIAAAGYPGVQFRANAITEFQPAELKDLLAQHNSPLSLCQAVRSRLTSQRQIRLQNMLPMHSSSRIPAAFIFRSWTS
jgi:sugar phosphate isomerase/epimerase